MHEIEGFVEGAKEKKRKRKRKRATKAKPAAKTQASAEDADVTESEETAEEEETVEEFSNQVDAFASAFSSARDTFIRDKCLNGVLMHKGFPVKSEMADHVYSEIQFNTPARCNPCDQTCDYSIVEAKIDTETELCPRSSNNLFDMVKDIFYPKRCSWKEPAAFQAPIQHK
jgi:hypothetical protein